MNKGKGKREKGNGEEQGAQGSGLRAQGKKTSLSGLRPPAGGSVFGLTFLPYFVFFLITFTYFCFFGDYVLFFQEKSSLFILSSDFLKENLRQPGGVLVWLEKLLISFCFYPATGALVFASILTLIVITSSQIIKLGTGKRAIFAPLIIGSALFFLQTDYRFMLMNNLGLLLQVMFFLLTIKFLKGWISVLIAPLVFFISGGFAWIYMILLTLHFMFSRENKYHIKISVLWVISLLFFYISMQYLFFQTTKNLLAFPFTDLKPGSQEKFFIPLSLLISILPALSRLNLTVPLRLRVSELTGNIISTGLISAILVTISYSRFDGKTSHYFEVEKLFYQSRFNDVIAYNTANPPTNSLTVFLNNVALCETGKLNDKFLSFQQKADGSTLFLKWEMIGEILRRGGYFYYTIGMINEAHRWAFENMVIDGPTPEGIKMLIRTELINGNYKMAAKYIELLRKTIFYRKEAGSFKKMLYNNEAVDGDREIGAKRKIKLKTDFFAITDNPYINIERVLDVDSLNRPAFEYKIAFLLLNKDYRGIAEQLPKFQAHGFSSFPVLVEEAVMSLSVLNDGTMPDIGNMTLNRDTEQRWEQYLTVFQKYGNNLQAAEPALRKQFGNTFWYYVFYR